VDHLVCSYYFSSYSDFTPSPLHIPAMTDNKVPQPGPAKLKPNAGPDEWLEAAKDCKYLSEAHMKQLCEMVKEYMMEGE
jgi:hypothetical protein